MASIFKEADSQLHNDETDWLEDEELNKLTQIVNTNKYQVNIMATNTDKRGDITTNMSIPPIPFKTDYADITEFHDAVRFSNSVQALIRKNKAVLIEDKTNEYLLWDKSDTVMANRVVKELNKTQADFFTIEGVKATASCYQGVKL